MRHFLAACALGIASVCSSQLFAADGIYLGHAIGGATLHSNATFDIISAASSAKLSSANTDFAGQLFAGYSMPVNEHVGFAIQFDGYLYAGSTNPINIVNAGTSVKLNGKNEYTYAISAIPEWRVTPISRILFKVGYARGYFKVSTDGNGITYRTREQWLNALHLGLGTEIAVTDSADFRLMASTNLYEEKEFTGTSFNTLKINTIQSQVMAGMVWHTDFFG